MEIHQLRYAVAIADHGSFTAAASAVQTSQSGVSAQVARLERELGVTLFERGSRPVRLTDAGHRLVDRMRTALAALDDIGIIASDVTGLLRGAVRIGNVAGLSWPAFLDALAAVHTEHPQLELSLREGVSGDLQQAVADGRLDVAVVSWPEEPLAGLASWVALVEHVMVVVGPDHPWADRDQVSPAELADQQLIVTTAGTGMRAAYELMMRREGLRAPVQWEVTLPTTVRTMAARGFGVGVVTSSAADPPSEVRRIAIDSPYARSLLGVVWRAQPQPSPAAQAVVTALRTHLGHVGERRNTPD